MIEYSSKDKYEPIMLIAIYQIEKVGESSGPPDMYLEGHIVENSKISEGKPLRHDTLSKLGEFLHRKSKEKEDGTVDVHGYTDPSFIYINPVSRSYAWVCKEKIRKLYFTKNLRIKSGQAWVPDLLFILSGTSLDVFALKNDHPNVATMTYHAPFFNTMASGAICLGNVSVRKHKSYDFAAIKELYEDAFFKSEFSEIHSPGVKRFEKNIINFWRSQIKTGDKFDHSLLVKTGKTIQQIIREKCK